MAYIPNTDAERDEMLRKIGVGNFEELINTIPEAVRLKKPLDLPERVSEFEIIKILEDYASQNITANTHTCFMGGGAYDHFTPTIVQSVLERPEFKTAYTPYQAEVSQGTLQAMYEFQSMICALTGMEVANASLYDGGSAVAEACLMAHNQNKKTKILLAGKLNPFYRQVVDTICTAKDLEFDEIVGEDGTCDLDALRNAVGDDTCAVVVQHPNAYGNLEDVHEIEKIVHSQKNAFYIASVDPISLGMLTPPGEYNADIVVGEGQPLGIPMNFGGPYLGLFACKQKYVRKIPGRLSGITQDADGKRGFVLTLQTREQQIKRERATSNICTNQGLIMLAATVYMAAMGKEGIREVAEQSFNRAHYLAEKISEIPGFKIAIDKPFFCEFLVETPVPAKEIIEKLSQKGILAGIDTSRFEDCKKGLLVAATEKRTREEMDRFAEELKQFSK
ncbi:MAG: aminomethyl-transferring glycine dehydrogenase subunit GcvPA [Candidatus Kapaibacterium sp.]